MRLGVMGGTFDPIHLGHLVTAEEALYQFELDHVVFVVSARPPHKNSLSYSPARIRLKMVELAVAGNPSFSASDLEIERDGPSYTLDTLKELRRVHGESSELYFITGADAILEILSWKEPEALLEESSFIAATRPGYPLERLKDALPETTRGGRPAVERVHAMEIPLLYISSTDIRERASAGKPYRYLVGTPVWEYIEANGLYRRKV